jgi:hypothetical protein
MRRFWVGCRLKREDHRCETQVIFDSPEHGRRIKHETAKLLDVDEGRKRALLIAAKYPHCAQTGTVRWWQESSGDNERNRGRGAVGRGNHEGQ